MIDQAGDVVTRLTALAQNTGALAAIVMILIALVVGRTLVKVLSTIVLVGIVLFAVAKPGYFKDKVGEDLDPAVQSMGRPPGTVADALAGLPVVVGERPVAT
jgi:hypothetical protein